MQTIESSMQYPRDVMGRASSQQLDSFVKALRSLAQA